MDRRHPGNRSRWRRWRRPRPQGTPTPAGGPMISPLPGPFSDGEPAPARLPDGSRGRPEGRRGGLELTNGVKAPAVSGHPGPRDIFAAVVNQARKDQALMKLVEFITDKFAS